MFLLKNIDVSLGEGALFSLIAILIVFIILIVIIVSVNLLSKIKFKEKEVKENIPTPINSNEKKLTIDDIKDDDMMVAALVATAEFVEETKEKDARLVSIKQIG